MHGRTFTVIGQPVAQPRHRVAVRGKHGVAYLPKGHPIHEYKAAVRSAGLQNFKHPLEGPIDLTIHFVFQRPNSHWNKSGLKKTAPLVIPKNDFDNLAKGCVDSLNGVCWIDDDQITIAHVVRRYSGSREAPGFTTITVCTDACHRSSN